MPIDLTYWYRSNIWYQLTLPYEIEIRAYHLSYEVEID